MSTNLDPTGTDPVVGNLLGSLTAELLPAVLIDLGDESAVNFGEGTLYASDGNVYELFIGTGAMDVGYDGNITLGFRDFIPSLSGFAIWQTVGGDPARTFVEAGNSGTVSAGVGAAWTRHWLTVHPAGDSAMWDKAAYAAVGLLYKGVPAAGVQYIDDVQVEMAPLATNMPGPFKSARSIQVRVRPTRLNLSTNPSFEVDTSSWYLEPASVGTATTLTRLATGGYVGPACAQTVSGTDNASVVHTVAGLVPGRDYIASLYVRNVSCLDVQIGVDGARDEPGKTGSTFNESAPNLVPGTSTDWRRLSITFVADYSIASLRLSSTGPVARSFHLDAVLVEEGNGLSDYFDGGFGAPDYTWESLGVEGKSRSYYYRDKVNRHYSLGLTLRENVAQGIFIEDPVYATSAISAPNPYGSGLYGDGPYGG